MTPPSQCTSHSPPSLAALTRLCRGFDTLAAVVALTLGPTRGTVLNDRGGGVPERLTSSGTVARRVIELPDRGQNVGAMLLRSMLLRMHEQYGDGAATAGVLAQAMIHAGIKMIAAGANPIALRRGIERGVGAARQALEAQAEPIAGQEMLARLAGGVTGVPELAALLGEMVDLLGENAAFLIEEFAAPHLDREYVDGGRWQARPAARLLLPDGSAELTLHNVRVLAIDEKLERAEQVRGALDLVVTEPDKPPLLIVTQDVSGEALQMLTMNHTRGVLTVGAVILTSASMFVGEDLSDIALLTGGQVLSEVVGRPPQRMHPTYFGRARRATLTRDSLTIVGGAGEQPAIRQRIIELRAQVARLSRGQSEWERLRLRVARLAGGVGIVKIGAYTEEERELKKEQAHKALRVLVQALEEGVVPGGGVAYLACIPSVLSERWACTDGDEACGIEVVAAALEAPFRQIVGNHGVVQPSLALAEVRHLGPRYGFDVMGGDYACMADAGVLDSMSVARGALEAAASTAALTLTTEKMVLVGRG